jgi:hypothetical protein
VKNGNFFATLDEIHAVARSKVYPHFADAVSDRCDVSGIAKRQPIDPRNDLRPRSKISQVLQPTAELVGSLD